MWIEVQPCRVEPFLRLAGTKVNLKFAGRLK